MRVIPPLTITDAILKSSTAAEPGTGEVVWNAGTAYTVGTKVYLAENHKRYECTVANTGRNPSTDTTTPAAWLELGPTNKWAMFDLLRNTATVQASPLKVVITPGVRFDSVALLGLVADAAEVVVKVANVVVYTKQVTLRTRIVTGWKDYYFKPFTTRPSFALFDLPLYTGATIEITLTRTTGNVECGACVIGTSEYLGAVEYDAQNDTLNFSRVDRDAFGNSVLVPRRNVPKTIQNIILDKSKVNAARAVRDALNAKPAVWCGLDDSADGFFESLFILGYYRRFSINLARPTEAVISLELEEV